MVRCALMHVIRSAVRGGHSYYALRSASRGKRYRHADYTYREQYVNAREASGI